MNGRKYYLLDSKKYLEPVCKIDEEQLSKILGMSGRQIRAKLTAKSDFCINDRYIVIEAEFSNDKNEEMWVCFHQNNCFLYYVSNEGRFKRIRKGSKKEVIIVPVSDRKCRTKYLNIDKRKVNAKKIVAKYWLKDYFEGCWIMCEDGNDANLHPSNLKIVDESVAKKNRSGVDYGIKCGLYVDGKLARTFASKREAARMLYCDISTITSAINGRSKLYDIRLL